MHAVWCAIIDDELDTAARMLDSAVRAGLSIDALKDRQGSTLLHMCSYYRREKALSLLLSYEPDLDSKDGQGNTPAMVCAANGFIPGLISLVVAGASELVKNNEGKSFADVATPEAMAAVNAFHARAAVESAINSASQCQHDPIARRPEP
jgi:ankyrin repeat protein